MENVKNWYVIHTKPKQERRIVDLLEKKRFRCYFPRYNQVQNWHGKRKLVSTPLFSSMIFVYATDQQQDVIKRTDGVNGILYWLQKPATVTEQEIMAIQRFLKSHTEIKLEKIKMNISSLISDEGYSNILDYDSNIFDLNDDNDKIVLPSLGYAITAKPVEVNMRVVA